MSKFILGFLLCLAMATCRHAHAAPPSARSIVGEPPGYGIQGEIAAYWGVKTCHELIVWILLVDGTTSHMVRIDQDHHPDDMQNFMRQLAGAAEHNDLIDLCPASKL